MAEFLCPSHPTDLRSLEPLLDDWPDAVFLFDADRERYLYVNRAAERLVGYRLDEILALRPGAFSHPDDAHEIPAIRAQAERDGWVRRPWRILRRDGTVVPTEMTLTRRRIDGRVISQGIFRVAGDGLLTGVQVLDVLARTGRPLAEVAGAAMTRLPQVLKNVRVLKRRPDVAEAVAAEIAAVEAELGERGRVLVRPSGTEPLVRVMIEATDVQVAERAADRLVVAVAAACGTI